MTTQRDIEFRISFINQAKGALSAINADLKQAAATTKSFTAEQQNQKKATDAVGGSLSNLGNKQSEQKKKTKENIEENKKAQEAFRQLAGSISAMGGPIDNAIQKTQKYTGVLQDSGAKMLGLGAVLVGLAAGFAKSITEASNFEVQQVRMNAVLQATGNRLGMTAQEVDAYTDKLASVSGQSQDSMNDAAIQLMRFGKIGKETFKEVLQASSDLAATGFVDVGSAAISLGRALENPAQGARMLKSLYVQLSPAQQQMVEQLTNAGRVAEAQAIIMKEVASSAKGAAEAMGQTLPGAVGRMRHQFGEFFEELGKSGGVLVPIKLIVNQLANAFEFLKENAKGVSAILGGALVGLGAYAALLGVAAIASVGAAAGVTGFGAAVLLATRNVIGFTTALVVNPLFWIPAIIAGATAALLYFKDTIFDVGGESLRLADILRGVWDTLLSWQGIKAIGGVVLNTVKGMAADILTVFYVVGNLIQNVFATAFEIIKEAFKRIWNGEDIKIGDIFAEKIKEGLQKGFKDAGDFNKEARAAFGYDEANTAAAAFGNQVKQHGVAARELHKKNEEIVKTLAKQKALDEEMTQNAMDRLQIMKDATKQLQDDIKLLQIPIELREREQFLMQVENKFLEKKMQLSKEDRKLLEEQYDQKIQLQKLDAETQRMYQEQVQQLKAIADTIKNDIGDAIEQGLDTGDFKFGDMLKNWSKKMKRFLIDMAVQAASNQILLNVGTQAGLSGNIMQAAGIMNASGTGAAQSGNILSLLSNGASMANNLMGGSGIFGAGSGIGSALDAFGASNLGLANVSGSFVGPLQSGMTAGTTLSGLLGTAGMGAGIGGLASSLTGGSSVGGTIGGMAGALLGNFILPGIGGWIGSALGGAIGGLFGKTKPSSKQQTGVVDLDTGNILSRTGLGGTDPNNPGKKFSKENYDAVTTLGAYSAALSKELGGITDQIRILVGDRNGTEILLNEGTANEKYITLGKSAGEVIKNLTQALLDIAPTVNENLQTALKNIDYSDSTKALSDVSFALAFDKIGQAPKVINATEQAIIDLKDQFEEIRKTAQRLGLDVEKVNEAEKNRLKLITSEFNNSLRQEITRGISPQSAAIQAEMTRYGEQLVSAASAQADLSLVDLLHKQKMLAIMDEYGISLESVGLAQKDVADYSALNAQKAQQLSSAFGKIVDDLSATISSLQLDSSLSPLTLEQKLGIARDNYNNTVAKANSGDVKALEELPQVAKDLLTMSRDFNSSNGAYSADFEMVQQELARAKDIAQQQKTSQDMLLTTAQSQLSAQTTANTTLQGILAALSKSTQAAVSNAFGATNAGGRLLSEVTSSGLTVGQQNAIAAGLGYTGVFGTGGHAAYLADPVQGAARTAAYNAAIATAAKGLTGHAAGTMQSSSTEPFWAGEVGPEVMIPRGTSYQVINDRQSANLTTNSQVMQLVSNLVEGFNGQREMLARIAANTEAGAMRDDSSYQLRRIADNTEPSRSNWRQ